MGGEALSVTFCNSLLSYNTPRYLGVSLVVTTPVLAYLRGTTGGHRQR